MPLTATRMGLVWDQAFVDAYWRAFEEFMGPDSAPQVKALFLSLYETGDTGSTDPERVCYGLRQTIPWMATDIEKRALALIGFKEL